MSQGFPKCVWIRHKLPTYCIFDVPPPPRIDSREIFGVYFRVVVDFPMRLFHTVSWETQRIFFCKNRSSAILLRCTSSWSSSASSMSVEASVAAGIRRFFASRGRKRFASCDKLTCIRCFGAMAIYPECTKSVPVLSRPRLFCNDAQNLFDGGNSLCRFEYSVFAHREHAFASRLFCYVVARRVFHHELLDGRCHR